MDFARPVRLGDITPKVLEDFQAHCIEDGLAARSVNAYFEGIQSIFTTAIRLKLFSGENPVKGATWLRTDKNPPKFLTKKQIDAVITAARTRGQDTLLFFALGIYAGLRKAEIGHARWEWIDFDNGLITLTSHEGFTLKDRESRSIPLNKSLRAILEPFRQEEGFIIAADKAEPGNSRYRYEPRMIYRLACIAILAR